MQAFLSLTVLPPLADVVSVSGLSLTVVSLGLLGQLGLVHVVLALGHGPDDVDAVSHALVDARGGGFRALLAGDELLLVTAHVVDELGEKDGGGGGGERGRERVKPREKCGGEAGLPNLV